MSSGNKSRKNKGHISKRGGYEPGPKTVSELKPPPKRPAPGARPKDDSGKKDS